MATSDPTSASTQLYVRLMDLIARLPEDTVASRQRLYLQVRNRFEGRPESQRNQLEGVIARIEREKTAMPNDTSVSSGKDHEQATTSATAPTPAAAKKTALLLPALAAVAAIAAAGGYFLLKMPDTNSDFSRGLDGYTFNVNTLVQAPDTGKAFDARTIGNDGLIEVRGPLSIFGIKAIPVDPSKRYVVAARVRVTQDDPTSAGAMTHIGVATFDREGNLQTDPPGAHRYAAAPARVLTVADGWIDLVGEISGTGNSNHHQFREGTASVRPVAILNAGSPGAVTEITSLSFTEVK